MNRRNFITALGLGITGLATSSVMGKVKGKENIEYAEDIKDTDWKNTRALGNAFDKIEREGFKVSQIFIPKELFVKAEEQEGGNNELSYLIDFEKKELWKVPIAFSPLSYMPKNEIHCWGGHSKKGLLVIVVTTEN